MSSEILKVKKWNEIQKELLGFLDQTKPVTGDLIREWIADCIVHFTDVNVPENIISHFLTKMEHVSHQGKRVREPNQYYANFDLESEPEKEIGSIGPFIFVGNGYKITNDNRLAQKVGGVVKITPILVSFKVAQNIIDNYENEARIVPQSLINELEKYKESEGVSVSLRQIQTSFENNDTQNMLTAIITTTDLLLKLIPELQKKKHLSDKLQKIYSDKALYQKYSINPEIIWSINNARIVRNIDIHVSLDENETTLYEAVSYVHLLNLLIFSILSSGEVKLTKN